MYVIWWQCTEHHIVYSMCRSDPLLFIIYLFHSILNCCCCFWDGVSCIPGWPLEPMMTLNVWSSYLHSWSAVITGIYHYTQLTRYSRSNPGLDSTNRAASPNSQCLFIYYFSLFLSLSYLSSSSSSTISVIYLSSIYRYHLSLLCIYHHLLSISIVCLLIIYLYHLSIIIIYYLYLSSIYQLSLSSIYLSSFMYVCVYLLCVSVLPECVWTISSAPTVWLL